MCLFPDPQWHDAQEGSWEGPGAGQEDRGSPQEEWSAHEEVQGKDKCSQAEKLLWSPKFHRSSCKSGTCFLFYESLQLFQASWLVCCLHWVACRRWRRTGKGQKRKEWRCRAARAKLMILPSQSASPPVWVFQYEVTDFRANNTRPTNASRRCHCCWEHIVFFFSEEKILQTIWKKHSCLWLAG